MERYALYLRKSRADKDAERAENTRDTLARHRAILLELAESKGISGEKIDVYEEVVSGDSISARPQIKKLIAAAEKHIYAGVLCMDIDRLARGDTVDQGIIARTFRLSNTLIITPKKIYDPSSEFDEEYFEFELFMARREFRMIGQRIQRGRVRSAGEGRFIGSKAPFGYDKVKLKNDKGYTLVENSKRRKKSRRCRQTERAWHKAPEKRKMERVVSIEHSEQSGICRKNTLGAQKMCKGT